MKQNNQESEKIKIKLKEYPYGENKITVFLNERGSFRLDASYGSEWRGGVTIPPKILASIGKDADYFCLNRDRYSKEDAIKVLQTDYEYLAELRKKERIL